jgi:hypothetical protein
MSGSMGLIFIVLEVGGKLMRNDRKEGKQVLLSFYRVVPVIKNREVEL